MRAEATFPGRLLAFPQVRGWAEAFGAAVGADRGTALRLVLVLEELFTNTVAHGYGGGDGAVWVVLSSRAGHIELIYEDAGPPFDPFAPGSGVRPDQEGPAESSPGGYGLALVRGLSVAACYARVGGRNRLMLTLAPEAPPTAPA